MTTPAALGRIPSPVDVRDESYRLSHELARRGIVGAPVGYRLWDAPSVYDQGQTPRCVGYSGAGFLTIRAAFEAPGSDVLFDADALYAYANAHDGDPTPHDGTTVRAAADALVSVGDRVVSSVGDPADAAGATIRLLSYLWGATTSGVSELDAVKQWVLSVSPVWVGTDWYEGMFTPDATGRLVLTGGIAGGHAWLLRGYDAATDLFVMRNSWGAWGGKASYLTSGAEVGITLDPATPGGDAYIAGTDLARLLSGNGEAVAAVDVVAPPVPPTPTPTPPPAPPTPPPPAPPTPPAPPPPAPTPPTPPVDPGALERFRDDVEKWADDVEDWLTGDQ